MLFFGNLVSMVGCVLMILTGFVRKRERVISLQCFQFAFLAAGNLILGAVSGFISGVVSVLRNLIFPRFRCGAWLKLVFIAGQVALTLMAGWTGPISLLPLAAGILLTWFLDAGSDIQLKAVIIAGQFLWAFYDFHYRNFVAFAFDVLTILSNLAGIFLIRRNSFAHH